MTVAALYPGARFYPLGAQTEARMTSHDIVCLHTMVGYLLSTDDLFRIKNGEGYRGTESHFGIGGKWGPDLGGGLDGASWQWQDLAFAANANLDGWHRVISIETADNAPRFAEDIEEWTPAQVDEIVELIGWLCSQRAHAKCPPSWRCHQEGIPRVLIPDSKPGRRGVGYHAQGAAEIVPGGEQWSSTLTKPCPARRRIAQIKTVIIPRLQGAPEEDPMADYAAQLNAIQAKVDGLAPEVERRVRAAISQLLGGTSTRVVDLLDRVRAMEGVVGDDEQVIMGELAAVRDEILAAVKPEPAPAAG